MTSWNYRIVKTETEDGPMWGVYEVYYDDDDKPVMRTADPTTFTSDDGVAGVMYALTLALDTARTRGPLDDSEIGGGMVG